MESQRAVLTVFLRVPLIAGLLINAGAPERPAVVPGAACLERERESFQH